MLDLDSLAERRAKSLNQGEDLWRDAVWSTDFQVISQNMTDGEVETLISWCPSVEHFRNVVKFLVTECQATGLPPFGVIMRSADGAGLKPSDWILRKV